MDALTPTFVVGSAAAAALAWCYRYASARESLENARPNERPLQMGRFYYRMPDGSIRSRRREYRKVLSQAKGITSGRQWVRARKRLPKAMRVFV